MLAARGHQQIGILVMMKQNLSIMHGIKLIPAPGHMKLGKNYRILLNYMTCMGMYGNGAGIGGMFILQGLGQIIPVLILMLALAVCYAAVAGTV